MKAISVLVILFFLAVGISWIGNLIKLTDCDFESPYRCEVVHVIGIIPILSLGTVWFEDDSN